MINSYDLTKLRVVLIELMDKQLNKESIFYKEDKERMIAAVNKKSRRELIETYQRQLSIMNVSEYEIKKHCQF